MKISGDYHTHSKYSKWRHGKNTIAQMVEAGKEKGLTQMAITDHGPGHIAFGIRKKNIDKARNEVDQINDSKVLDKVYLGLEANLVGADGKIDLSSDDIKKLDVLVVGFHRGTLNNIIKPLGIFPHTKKQIERQTNAYISMLNRYDVDFISHLGEYIKVDFKRVAEECAKTGTYLEINNRHYEWSDENMRDILSTGVRFVVSSDAHKTSRVAEVSNALEVIKKFNIPAERVANIGGDFIPKKFRTEPLEPWPSDN